MQRVTNYADGVVVQPADLNAIQDNALGIAQALGFTVRRPDVWSTDGVHINVGPIGYMVLGNNVWGVTTTTVVNTSGLAASTWYYLYASIVANALVINYSTTIPDTSNAYQDSAGVPDRTQIYLGCFLTDISSVVLPFRAVRGRYLWRTTLRTNGDFKTLLTGSSAGSALLPLQNAGTSAVKLVPPHARLAELELEGHAAATGTVNVRSEGDTISSYFWNVAASSYNTMTATFDIGPTQTLKYLVTGGADLTATVLGFTE